MLHQKDTKKLETRWHSPFQPWGETVRFSNSPMGALLAAHFMVTVSRLSFYEQHTS